MTEAMWTALLSAIVAVSSVFGVKLLDAMTNGKTKRIDELAQVRANQETRIENLEKKLEAKDREFDAYRDETNEKMNELRDQLREVKAENRELKAELARYKEARP